MVDAPALAGADAGYKIHPEMHGEERIDATRQRANHFDDVYPHFTNLLSLA